MPFIDFAAIVREAWMNYDESRVITRIADISAKVSTNHVYRITFDDGQFIIGKLSYFGKYEHFVEDHRIINVLSNNLPSPFENLLARALFKGNDLFVYRHHNEIIDAWVVFYRPIQIKKKLPRRLNEEQIETLGEQMASFHKACSKVRHTLPPSSKTTRTDIDQLMSILETDYGRYVHRMHIDDIRRQSETFLRNREALNADDFEKIPVFVDWNIGNFSVTSTTRLFSRWDYDWFRMGSRVLDFYFLSRVVSDVGDRTVFSYNVSTLAEPRFLRFLKSYHQIYPLNAADILAIKEAYRFFILNYVIKDGRYFFHEIFATKLRKEAFESYFPSIDSFDPDKLISALNI